MKLERLYRGNLSLQIYHRWVFQTTLKYVYCKDVTTRGLLSRGRNSELGQISSIISIYITIIISIPPIKHRVTKILKIWTTALDGGTHILATYQKDQGEISLLGKTSASKHPTPQLTSTIKPIMPTHNPSQDQGDKLTKTHLRHAKYAA